MRTEDVLVQTPSPVVAPRMRDWLGAVQETMTSDDGKTFPGESTSSLNGEMETTTNGEPTGERISLKKINGQGVQQQWE